MTQRQHQLDRCATLIHAIVLLLQGTRMTRRRWVRSLLLQNKRFGALGSLVNEFLVDAMSVDRDESLRYFYKNPSLLGGGRLPAGIRGSIAQRRERVRQQLAVLRRFNGKPSYFITFTCNRLWEEIIQSLLPGQTAYDAPLLACRIFYLKLKVMSCKA
jgi:hypothetical protein